MSYPNLCEVMRQWRWAARLELKNAAAQIGVSDATLSRFERGENVSGETLAKIISWLLSEAAPNQQRLGLDQPREGSEPARQEPGK